MLSAADLATIVQQDLDDPQLLRTTPETMLRHLSRAQQWVALRYRLLRHSYPLTLTPKAPFLDLFPSIPRLVGVTHVANDLGTTLYPLSLSHLRLYDPAWIATAGTPGGYYRIGWRILGFYPVQQTEVRYTITALILPVPLLTLSDLLTIPDSFATQTAKVTAGLLTIGQSRRYEEGKSMILEGLGGVTPQALPGQGGPRAA